MSITRLGLLVFAWRRLTWINSQLRSSAYPDQLSVEANGAWGCKRSMDAGECATIQELADAVGLA